MQIVSRKKTTVWHIVLDQFSSIVVWLLAFAALISFFTSNNLPPFQADLIAISSRTNFNGRLRDTALGPRLAIIAASKIPVVGWFGLYSVFFILIYFGAIPMLFMYEKRRHLPENVEK